MKNLLYGIGCLVVGLVLIGIGFTTLTSGDVKCGDRVMQHGESCHHSTRRGGSWDNDYGSQRSSTNKAGVVLLIVGPVMALGGVFFLQDAVRDRRRGAARVPAPAPGRLPAGPAPPPAHGYDPAQRVPAGPFGAAVELRCVLGADAVVKRMIPMLAIMAVVVWLVAAVAVGIMVPDPAAVSAIAATLIAASVVAGMYLHKRTQLRRVYGHQQRLIVHPGGLRRFDPWTVIDIAWTGITHFEWRNSSLPPAGKVPVLHPAAAGTNRAISNAHTVPAWGIVGQGTIAPLPGASRRMLRFQDQLYGSNLDGGHPHSGPGCVIFPAEFETAWTTGTIGAWLRHYRPDLPLPD